MSIFEYDEEKHMQALRSAGYEDGLEQGIEQGIEQGARNSRYQIICNMLREHISRVNQPLYRAATGLCL